MLLSLSIHHKKSNNLVIDIDLDGLVELKKRSLSWQR